MSTEIPSEKLLGAMKTVENDVQLPGRIRAHSVVGNLVALSKGEIFTLSQEFDPDLPIAVIQRDANALKNKMRSSMTSSVRHAKDQSGKQFSMESALITYPSGRVFIQVAVTCIDDQPEDDEV